MDFDLVRELVRVTFFLAGVVDHLSFHLEL
jgi:hypothetical protein